MNLYNFIMIWTSIESGCNHTKCVLLKNQKFMTLLLIYTLMNALLSKLHYYPFAVNLDRCAGVCSTLDELSNKVCAPNETEDLNLHVFNMTTRTKESRTLTKHMLCKCEFKFDTKKINLNQTWNNDKCQCECKK